MVNSKAIEPWALYAGGSVIIFLRIFTRTKMVGVRGYWFDDYLVIPAWVCQFFPGDGLVMWLKEVPRLHTQS